MGVFWDVAACSVVEFTGVSEVFTVSITRAIALFVVKAINLRFHVLKIKVLDVTNLLLLQ